MDWPHEIPSEQLSAGFIYTQNRDVVKYVACDIRLREWEKNDCPWKEHWKLSPECPYIKMVKGE